MSKSFNSSSRQDRNASILALVNPIASRRFRVLASWSGCVATI